MKLKEYFQDKKNLTISQQDKFFLYEKIISQKTKRKFLNINSFINIKSFAYWFVMIILLVWIYGVYFFNWDFSYEWFMVQNNTNQVSADYIANIVQFNWTFYIKHEWRYYKTNKISNWDNVILKKWSEIVFDMNSGTKAKITGPARFVLHQNENNYQLLISEWDFIKMESTEQNTNSMEIILDDITISSQKNINLLITKQNNKYTINNQWWNIVVTKDNDIREVKKQQLLAIKDNDITLIENIEDFWEAIARQNVSQTFAIQTEQTSQQNENITALLLKEIDTNNLDNTQSNDNISMWLAQDLGFLDQKQIPSKEQSKEIYSILNKESILYNLEWLFKNQLLWDQKEQNHYRWTLESKIQKIYKIFNINYNNRNTMIENIKNIQEEFTNNYHIPEKYTNNLTIIINRITHIQSIENWSNTNIQEVDQLWNSIKTNPPSNLVLK